MIRLDRLAAEMWAASVPNRTPDRFGELSPSAMLRWMRAARRAMELTAPAPLPALPRPRTTTAWLALYPSGALIGTGYGTADGPPPGLQRTAEDVHGCLICLGFPLGQYDYRESESGE